MSVREKNLSLIFLIRKLKKFKDCLGQPKFTQLLSSKFLLCARHNIFRHKNNICVSPLLHMTGGAKKYMNECQ